MIAPDIADVDGDQDTSELVNLYYGHKLLGTVTHLTGPNESVVEQYLCSPYGETEFKDGQGNDIGSESAVGNPFVYTGRWFDAETGLYHYRHRTYDPIGGRFLQRDPLGNVDGPNLSEYARSSPARRRDPMGTISEELKRAVEKRRRDWNDPKKRPRIVEKETDEVAPGTRPKPMYDPKEANHGRTSTSGGITIGPSAFDGPPENPAGFRGQVLFLRAVILHELKHRAQTEAGFHNADNSARSPVDEAICEFYAELYAMDKLWDELLKCPELFENMMDFLEDQMIVLQKWLVEHEEESESGEYESNRAQLSKMHDIYKNRQSRYKAATREGR